MRIELLPADRIDPAAWDALAATGDNVFYERWAVAAALHLAGVTEPQLLVGYDGDTLVALLPLVPRRSFGLTLAIENWDQRIRAIGGPLVAPGRERAFWEAALAMLDREGQGAALRLSSLAADAPSTVALIDLLRAHGRRFEETRSYERAILSGGTSAADHAKEHVRGKVLKEHRRLRARLADRDAVAFERLAAGADADPWIADLFALELTGWKGRDGVAAASDPATEAAFRDLLRAAHARGRLDFHRLTVGGVPIAMLANIEGPGETAVQLKITYDEAWASFSPGVLLEMAYLEHALDVRRLALVDSCARAGHPMIDRIWPARRTIVSLAIPFDRWSSRLAVAAQATARRWRHRQKEAA